MEFLSAYIPADRRQAIMKGEDLPDRSSGAALFADISGFTPLTEALVKDLGPKRGAEELTYQLNTIFDALIAEVDRYRGSVIVFGGDAITCWFADKAEDRFARLKDESASPVSLQPSAWRAVACGLAMQEAMQPFASLTTPSGSTVSLAMKAAIAAGPVRRFLVGDPQIQWIDVLAGRTLDDMAAGEHHANRGEVVLHPTTAMRLRDKVVVSEWREGDGGRFAVVSGLQVQVTPDPWQRPDPSQALTEAQLRPWLLPPVYERLIAGQEQFLAEIRPTVTLFLKFGGIDYDHDAAAGEKLDAYLRWVQAILTRYEGYALQVSMGDKGSYLYAAFGAPLAHDDDPARALAAAFELGAPPPELDFIHDIQIGVSRGRNWAGAYGGASRRTYGVLGDAVNLAARLMAKAEPGQILVSQPIVEATEQAYDFRSIGRVHLKGKEPLPAFQALARRTPSAQKSLAHYPNPLVGRDAELAQMGEILESALAGEGQILRLEGSPGMGKSHLAAEFTARAERRRARVAVGACQSTTQGIAYTPWRQAFRALFALPDDEPPDRQAARVEASLNAANPSWLVRLPLLGDLLGLPIPDNATTAAFDPRLRQEALFTLALELIQHWAQAQPLLLLIEDAHWMDEASLGLALALGRVIARARALLVLVQRPPLREDKPLLPDLNRLASHHQLNLDELSSEGIAALVTNRLQGRPSALALTLVQAQAQGNPFFIEELVDALRESGALRLRDDGTWFVSEAMFNALREANCLTRAGEGAVGEWTLAPNAPLSAVNLGLPDSVHGAVLSRIDRLPEAHKVTLKVASVIGRVFGLDVLARAHPAYPGREAMQTQLQTFERRDFSRLEVPPPHTAYVFKHSITQEVVYETLLEAQQRALHRAVGTALEKLRPEGVEQLAYHFSRAGLRDKALVYLEKAARKAQHESANETALGYYQQALTLEERWEWRKGQIEVLHILGRRDEELAALRALEAMPEASPYEVAYLWGQSYEAVSDYVQAQAAVERALTIVRDQFDQVSEARCLAQLGLIARRHGNYEGAKDWYHQALELFPEAMTGSWEEAQVLAQALNGLGIVHRHQGNYDEAKQCYERALTTSRQNGDRRSEAEALNSLGGTFTLQRDFTGAIAYYRQALGMRRAIGDRAGEGTALYNLASSHLETGNYGQAQQYFEEALAIQQAIGNRWEEVNVWNGLGVLFQELGDLPKAQTHLQRGLALTREIGDEAGQAYLLSNLGLVARDQGALALAEKLLADGLALAQAQGDKYQVAVFLSYLSSVSLRAGQVDQAMARAAEALTLRRELGLRLQTTAELTTLAAAYLATGNVNSALDYAQQALTLLDECGGEGPEFPQQDYFICHQVLSAAGRTEAARAALRSAYKLVMARAEKISDPSLRQSFLERVQINREIMQAFEGREDTNQIKR